MPHSSIWLFTPTKSLPSNLVHMLLHVQPLRRCRAHARGGSGHITTKCEDMLANQEPEEEEVEEEDGWRPAAVQHHRADAARCRGAEFVSRSIKFIADETLLVAAKMMLLSLTVQRLETRCAGDVLSLDSRLSLQSSHEHRAAVCTCTEPTRSTLSVSARAAGKVSHSVQAKTKGRSCQNKRTKTLYTGVSQHTIKHLSFFF